MKKRRPGRGRQCSAKGRKRQLASLTAEEQVQITRHTGFDATSIRSRPLNLPLRDTVLELKMPAGYQGALYIRDLAYAQ